MAAGVEFGDLNWLGIAAGFVFTVVFGFVWYAKFTPTGRIWMREMKVPAGAKPTTQQMVKGLGLMVVGTAVMMIVFAHVVIAFRDAYRLDGERLKGLELMDGIEGGFFTWLGFFMPVQLSRVSWENARWSLFFVNSGYYLINLIVVGILLVVVPT